MPLQLGTSSALFRVGSGSPSKVFLGTVSIQNVPGAPVITGAQSQGMGGGEIFFTPPADGGTPILGYNVYVNESSVAANTNVANGVASELVGLDFESGDTVRIAAVNAIGEGPKSASFTST